MRVGYVGRLEAHKGVTCCSMRWPRCPASSCVIVGDGPEREAIERAGSAISASTERVTLRGFAAHDDLPDLYRSFDVLVVPSLETPCWIEQFGRVAVEAMASGVPVVASDSGSLPEVLGGAGVLVPPGDVGAPGRRARAPARRPIGADPDGRRRSAAGGLLRLVRGRERHLDLYEEMLG